MLDRYSPHRQGIRYEAAMTSPRHGLRAHDRDPFASSRFNQALQSFPKFRRKHVIGIPAKALVLPCRVRRIGARAAQSAQSGLVRISYPVRR